MSLPPLSAEPHKPVKYIDFISWQKALFLLATLFLLAYILPLNVRPLFTPDEVRYAEIAREMLSSGNWVVPHFIDFRYFEKPPMGYWMNAISLFLFDNTPFAIRFSSAISTAMTALAVFFLVLKTTRRVYPSLLSSLIYLTFLQVFIIGTLGILDAILAFWLSLAMIAFFLGEINVVTKNKAYIALGVFCGLAFLTKGFLALAVPVIVIVPYMIWQKRFVELLQHSWIPILTATLLVMPWAIAIQLNEGDFWRYFFWEEHIKRFTSTDAHHVEPFWYFLPVILLFSLPWTSLLPVAVEKLIAFKRVNAKQENEVKLIQYSLLWFIIPFLFFSVSKGKLATYILPCYLPLGVLLALGLERFYGMEGKNQSRLTKSFEKISIYSNYILALVMIALIIFVQWSNVVKPIFFLAESDSIIKTLLLVFSFVAWWAVTFIFASKKLLSQAYKPFIYVLIPFVLMLSIPFAIPDKMRITKVPEQFLMQQKQAFDSNTILIGEHVMMGALSWFYQRKDVYLTGGQGEFEYGLSYPEANFRHIPYAQLKSFIEKARQRHTVMFFDKTSSIETPEYVPEPDNTISENRYVLRIYQSSEQY